MLDKKTEQILGVLRNNIGTNFKVVNKADILSWMPEKLRMDKETLAATMIYLKEKDYLTVKYQDKDEICLAVTVRAESYLENDKNTAEKTNLSVKQYGFVFLFGFLGAFAGSMIALLLSNLF